MSLFTTAVEGSIWRKGSGTITPLSSINTQPLTSTITKGAVFIFNIYNKTEGVSKIVQMNISNPTNLDSELKSNAFAHVGSLINISLNEKIVSGNLIVELTNNESFNLNIDYAYLQFGQA